MHHTTPILSTPVYFDKTKAKARPKYAKKTVENLDLGLSTFHNLIFAAGMNNIDSVSGGGGGGERGNVREIEIGQALRRPFAPPPSSRGRPRMPPPPQRPMPPQPPPGWLSPPPTVPPSPEPKRYNLNCLTDD